LHRKAISQLIRKYHNGELDARAMHQLEKEAQNDPFLMEALEGYEQSGLDQQPNLDDVYARLRDRTQKAERRIIPWKWISIAASILVVLLIGRLLFRHHSPEVKNTLVKITKPKQAPTITKLANIDNVDALIHPPSATKLIANNKHRKINRNIKTYSPIISADAASAPPPSADIAPNQYNKDTASLGEVAVIGYTTQKKTLILGSASSIPQGFIADKNIPEVNNELSGKVAGVNITQSRNKPIIGIVKDETNQPIPGATVKIKGTDKSAVTDMHGKFVLPDVSSGSTLDVAFMGYNSRKITVKNPDSLVIAMQPNTASLSEVVVTGYGVKKQDDEQLVYEAAHPANGWGDFKRYLKDNAKSPDGKTGVVKISFSVDQYGLLSDFKILKSLSTESDNMAIQLIQTGPRWITNTDHKPETITVRVRFSTRQ
jgi:hypothetical protein